MEYPTKTDHFVCPEEVMKVYGETPRDLEVILPADSIDEIFPQALKYYKAGSAGPWCSGNMERAFRADTTRGMVEIQCPCEFLEPDEKDRRRCKEMGNLFVILPRVSLGGVYQIDTGSINSILNINSGLQFIADRNRGRLANVPCLLTLRPQECNVKGKKSQIFVMNLTLANFDTIRRLRGQMDEVRSLLSGDAPPCLPEPSLETDLIPAEVVESIPHDASEEAPPAPADHFTPPVKPRPGTTRRMAPVRQAPPAHTGEALTVGEYGEMWNETSEQAERSISQTRDPRAASQARPAQAPPTTRPAAQAPPPTTRPAAPATTSTRFTF
jgi:hypothetical protein